MSRYGRMPMSKEILEDCSSQRAVLNRRRKRIKKLLQVKAKPIKISKKSNFKMSRDKVGVGLGFELFLSLIDII